MNTNDLVSDLAQGTSVAPLITATVAVVAALIAAASFRISRASLHQTRTALMAQVRSEWARLHSDWVVSLALARGPGDYYSGATAEQRDAIRQLAVNVKTATEISAKQSLVFAYGPPVDHVRTFLDLCASLTLQGRLLTHEIYTILGPDVTRHGKSVRWLLGMVPADWEAEELPANFDEPTWLMEVTDDSSPGRQERILALLDLLWAQASKTGDLEAHILIKVASHKQGGPGEANRRRVRMLGRQWRGRMHAFRLQLQLLYAEFITPNAIYQQGREILDEIRWSVLRVGLWRFRALLTFGRSYIFMPDRLRLFQMRVRSRRKRPCS